MAGGWRRFEQRAVRRKAPRVGPSSSDGAWRVDDAEGAPDADSHLLFGRLLRGRFLRGRFGLRGRLGRRFGSGGGLGFHLLTLAADLGVRRGGADAARLRSRRGERGIGREHGAREGERRRERRGSLRAGVELAGLQLRRRARGHGRSKGRGLSHQGCESEDDAVHFRWLLHETFGDETI